MKKLIFSVIILLSFMMVVQAGPAIGWSRDEVLAKEKMEEKIFSKEYEKVPFPCSDRIENGQCLTFQDFIRPEEVSATVSSIFLPTGVEGIIETVYSFVKKNIVFESESESADASDWQTPAETIARGKGDCEDLAFLLASMLLAAGIPEEFVWINTKNFHMYTTIEFDGKIKVLECDTENFYLYDWPSYRWNRKIVERKLLL